MRDILTAICSLIDRIKKYLKKKQSLKSFYVTNSGAGIKELPVEAIKANRAYFRDLLEKAKKRLK